MAWVLSLFKGRVVTYSVSIYVNWYLLDNGRSGKNATISCFRRINHGLLLQICIGLKNDYINTFNFWALCVFDMSGTFTGLVSFMSICTDLHVNYVLESSHSNFNNFLKVYTNNKGRLQCNFLVLTISVNKFGKVGLKTSTFLNIGTYYTDFLFFYVFCISFNTSVYYFSLNSTSKCFNMYCRVSMNTFPKIIFVLKLVISLIGQIYT